MSKENQSKSDASEDSQDLTTLINEKSEARSGLEHVSYEGLLTQLNELDRKCNEAQERALRLQADAENNRRRFQRDLENAHKYALDRFIPDLLPIVDSLERSLSSVDMRKENALVREGIELTLKLFLDTLAKFSVEQINPIGAVFNPDFHEAISMEESAIMEAGKILNVIQKGYSLNGRLLRPALVTVVKPK